MSDQEVLKRISRARTHLLLDHPFFGALALRLKTELGQHVPTAGTDGLRIVWNPDFVTTLTDAELMGVVAHEILHVSNGHHWRIGARDVKRWNIATDLAINSILKDCGFELPAGGLFPPETAKGHSGEWYYQHIEESEADGASGSDGDSNDPGGCGAVMRPSGPQDQIEQDAAEWKIATAQAALAAKQAGKLPKNLERFVEELLEHKICWTVLLRDFVERSARNDYNWTRPNRRYLSRGIILPSLISEELPETVVVIDTSGSIGQAELSAFAAEASAVLGAYDTTIHLLYVDATVAHTEMLTRADLPFTPKAYGGGGTDFRPAFAWVEEQGITPSCLIYLTDMYGTFPNEAPEYPVLWVSTTKDTSAPFGLTVKLEVPNA